MSTRVCPQPSSSPRMANESASKARARFSISSTILRGKGSLVPRRQQSCGIENESKLRCDVDECSQQWIEEPESGKADPDPINQQGSGEIRHDDPMAAPGDLDGLHKLQEIIA